MRRRWSCCTKDWARSRCGKIFRSNSPQRPATEFSNLFNQRPGFLLACAIIDGNTCACLSGAEGNRASDPSAGAGDEHETAGQIDLHVVCPLLRTSWRARRTIPSKSSP